MGADPRVEVRDACRVLAVGGLDDLIWGHVSARDIAGRGFWIKRSGIGFAEVTVDDVHLLNWDGEIIDGDGPVHIEWPIHAGVLRARGNVGAVVHTHGRHAVAFSATRQPLQAMSHEGALFVPPPVPVFTQTGNLIRTAALGAEVAGTLGGSSAVLLARHGTVVVGADVALATVSAVLFERACAVQLAAMAASSGALDASDDAEALEKRLVCWPDTSLRAAWHHLRRIAGIAASV
jgi:L-ribulose-5-phosphate 4-epimerase